MAQGLCQKITVISTWSLTPSVMMGGVHGTEMEKTTILNSLQNWPLMDVWVCLLVEVTFNNGNVSR